MQLVPMEQCYCHLHLMLIALLRGCNHPLPAFQYYLLRRI